MFCKDELDYARIYYLTWIKYSKSKSKPIKHFPTYFIPGLGCDRRIFQNLIPKLDLDEIHFLDYIEPLNSYELLASYSKRLVCYIPKNQPVNLIGMSMGGTLAIEAAKVLNVNKLVIISSIKHQNEVPLYFKALTFFPVQRLLSPKLTRWTGSKLIKALGVTDEEGKAHYTDMIYDATDMHLKWGRDAIVRWRNDQYPENIVHIHGTRDHIFNAKYIKNAHLIEGGTHYLVMDRAKETAQIINEVFQT